MPLEKLTFPFSTLHLILSPILPIGFAMDNPSVSPRRPVTPPPIAIAKVPSHVSAKWVTPASPTRPGPPMLAPPVNGSPTTHTTPRVLLADDLPPRDESMHVSARDFSAPLPHGTSHDLSRDSPIAASPGPPVVPVPVPATAPAPATHTIHVASIPNGTHTNSDLEISAPIAVQPIIPRQTAGIIENPVVIDPGHIEPVVIENPEILRKKAEAREAERRAISKAIRRERRREKRRIKDIDNDDLNALIRSADKVCH
jgi:hypothetical protein